MDFFKSLETELQPEINKILKHPFLQRIDSGSLTKEQLQYFAKQYNIYCRAFPRFLCAAAANIPDDATRMPIMQNLWEEHGEGEIAKSHRSLFNRFATALDLTEGQLQKARPLPYTSICVENLMNLCQTGHFVESLGALGPGTEFFTSDEYQIIAEGLSHYDFLNQQDIEFWTAHITLDETHYSTMVDALRPWSKSEENRKRIRHGARKAIELEQLFWDGLEDNLKDKKNDDSIIFFLSE